MGDNQSEMSEDEDKPSDLTTAVTTSGGRGGGEVSNKSRSIVSGGCSGDCSSLYPDQVLENVLENVLVFLTSRKDRNSASLVCKSWFRAEALTRSDLFIGNCYAVSPHRVIQRFRKVQSLVLKGKPRFADFDLVPVDWGAHFSPWVNTMSTAYPCLEKICLKRMWVTNDDLIRLASAFPAFKELVLVCCEGFGLSGLAMIADGCRQIRVFDLIECGVDNDDGVDWISYFPESGTTCLESLIFDCVELPVNFDALESLVTRSPSLKKLRLNGTVPIQELYRLMVRAPQLTHLGTGAFNPMDAAPGEEQELDLSSAFDSLKYLTCLSGFRDMVAGYLPSIQPVCANLTSLNFSYADINAEQLKPIISRCKKLQTFWVLDSVHDEGLQAVAAACKDLRELRVFPADVREESDSPVSDVGLLAISEGCRKLRSILYFCNKMTNAAVVAMSKNCPELVVFRLCIMGRHAPDHLTGEPMDEGFGAIVMNCKKLRRLAVSGLLTDKAFNYMGRYGKLVRTLSVAFAGDSDMGLTYVLQGCPELQKLEIRDSPFGDTALLSGLHHYHNMRFLWMSSCKLTLGGCKEVARRLPQVVVEVISDHSRTGPNLPPLDEKDLNQEIEKLYMYRSLEGRRNDAPEFVKIL
ncbi:Transport inhibitor response 1-like protein [Thalictrum thalictroides]|uniref:Transport inhibitor response 1-like protein n=1 Tax=Thalictrum thalictroides TaxID=46969 RepID=A0A7J6W203_THATH|nr:Transport inhibitor response 1-like protein [Thalictrum thalictroides]